MENILRIKVINHYNIGIKLDENDKYPQYFSGESKGVVFASFLWRLKRRNIENEQLINEFRDVLSKHPFTKKLDINNYILFDEDQESCENLFSKKEVTEFIKSEREKITLALKQLEDIEKMSEEL